MEQDAKDVDKWRAKAITGHAASPAAQVSLAEIQAEMKRLARLAASMQGAPEPASALGATPQRTDEL